MNKKLKRNSTYSKYKSFVTIDTTVQKFGVSNLFIFIFYFCKKIIPLFSKDVLN